MSLVSDFATENYLKTIVKALAEPGRERLGTGEVARLLGVTSGTATTMIKKLEKAGYVIYQAHQGCSLTLEGRRYGLRILRRHRLLETFLVNVLGMDWSDVHEEAERLEHAASEQLIDTIDAYLGRPLRDPHGDPIPVKAQTEYRVYDRPLSSLKEGSTAMVVRVEGNKPHLSYYQAEGLVPGAIVQIMRKQDTAELATLSVNGSIKQFSFKILNQVFVEETPREETRPVQRSVGGTTHIIDHR